MNIYKEKEKFYSNKLKELNKKLKLISNLRLFIFIAGSISTTIIFYNTGSYPLFFIFLFLSIATFTIVLFKNISLKQKYQLTQNIHKILNDSIDRLRGKWTHFEDTGEEFINNDHRYSSDIDIFGHGSLFQYINATTTYLGRIRFKNALTEPLDSIPAIKPRQQAIAELADKLDWRLEFQGKGLLIPNRNNNPTPLFDWVEDNNYIIKKRISIFSIRFLSALTIASIIFAFTETWHLKFMPLIFTLSQLLILFLYKNKMEKTFRVTQKFKDDIEKYKNLLIMIEKEEFNSEYLKERRQKLFNIIDGNFASMFIDKLETIVDRINMRYSSIHFFINIITMWDLHCIISLEKWKKNVKNNVRDWINVIGELEELSSFAIIKHDNNHWAVPEFVEDKNLYSAESLGHPLIHSDTRVNNDIHLSGDKSIAIITGSNMSGKTTMLRTIGINLILAYNGAPVCATKFYCSINKIYTSLRKNDNLEKGISSFYGELLRIKMIIDASKNEPILFLLDEIFNGTNSIERKIGAKAILKNLNNEKTMGLITTHDIDIIEKSDGFIKFNFREIYKDNRIIFNYKMYPGISNTRDALFIMKMVGINI